MFKWNKKEKEENKNPDGLTYDEFVKQYEDIHHLANLCWHLGIKPEQLKEEIKVLLEKY